ncbi:MAG: hypothetical protein JNK87_38625 [Bryobacterales bacterium]|nr:hypothetical protein [Bryobacterales bacterium]
MLLQVAVFPILLTGCMWAAAGAVVESPSPAKGSTIAVADNHLTAVAVTLAEAIQSLQPRIRLKVATEIAQRRYDLRIQAAEGETLTDALQRSLLQDVGLKLVQTTEPVPVWVFRPTSERVQPMNPYPPGVPRGHFSCRSCSVDDLGSALERGLNAPVKVEPKDLIFSGIMVEWLDQTSLLAAVQSVLGLRGSLETKELPVINVSPVN